jgi:hypothetical protein
MKAGPGGEGKFGVVKVKANYGKGKGRGFLVSHAEG